jgi:hypothetical protein
MSEHKSIKKTTPVEPVQILFVNFIAYCSRFNLKNFLKQKN